ncbi:MAG: hypothetical protein JKY65_01935 [Planctomycetes bacterium]|nr:hypothetical protein [Planctomycetota bacterium]
MSDSTSSSRDFGTIRASCFPLAGAGALAILIVVGRTRFAPGLGLTWLGSGSWWAVILCGGSLPLLWLAFVCWPLSLSALGERIRIALASRRRARGNAEEQASPSAQEPQKKSFLRRAASVAFYMVFLLVLIELGSCAVNRIVAGNLGRVSLDKTAVIPAVTLGHELDPTYAPSGWKPQHNAQGFKYPEDISGAKPTDVIRIFALGGSTLYGWGNSHLKSYPVSREHLTNKETITFFLEKKLNAHFAASGFRFQVLNGGVPDYTSQHHLLRLNTEIYLYEPDMVLLVDGANEFYTMEEYNPLLHYSSGGRAVLGSFNERSFWFSTWVSTRFLAQYSETFKTLQHAALRKWEAEEKGNPFAFNIRLGPKDMTNLNERYRERARRTFLWTYHQLAAATSYRGTPMAVFLQPQIVFEDPSLLSPNDQKTLTEVRKIMGPSEGVSVDDTVTFMNEVRRLLPELFQEIGVTFYERAVFTAPLKKQGSVDYFLDYTHLTPEGSAEFGGRMFESLLPSIETLVSKRKSAAQEQSPAEREK